MNFESDYLFGILSRFLEHGYPGETQGKTNKVKSMYGTEKERFSNQNESVKTVSFHIKIY